MRYGFGTRCISTVGETWGCNKGQLPPCILLVKCHYLFIRVLNAFNTMYNILYSWLHKVLNLGNEELLEEYLLIVFDFE